MSQKHFGSSSVATAAAPPKPRRLYQLPDEYADSGSDPQPPALHVSKVS